MWSAGGSSEECGDDVGGVAVEADAGTVVSHGRTWISVAGRFLHVTQWHPGVERGSDERVPQRVRADALGDPGPMSDAAHDARGGVTVQSFAIAADKDRSF